MEDGMFELAILSLFIAGFLSYILIMDIINFFKGE